MRSSRRTDEESSELGSNNRRSRVTSFKDHFSDDAAAYARWRPTYPEELFSWLADQSASRHLAWDCASGSGQAALGLAAFFDSVVASDASLRQVFEARREVGDDACIDLRIEYCSASSLPSSCCDLVVVAQALHWFNLPRFYREALRVLRSDGLLAAWSYGLLRVEPEIDSVLRHFSSHQVGPYWPAERSFVETGYQALSFPAVEIPVPAFEMSVTWSLARTAQYIRTWSAVRRFESEQGFDPVEELIGELAGLWHEPRRVTWPLALRACRPGRGQPTSFKN